jgi:hypothetical protein
LQLPSLETVVGEKGDAYNIAFATESYRRFSPTLLDEDGLEEMLEKAAE